MGLSADDDYDEYEVSCEKFKCRVLECGSCSCTGQGTDQDIHRVPTRPMGQSARALKPSEDGRSSDDGFTDRGRYHVRISSENSVAPSSRSRESEAGIRRWDDCKILLDGDGLIDDNDWGGI